MKSTVRRVALGTLLVVWALASPELAAKPNERPGDSADVGFLGGGLELFPDGELFPRYVADPNALTTGVLYQSFSSTGIEGAGSRRFHLKVGGSFGLLRWLPDRPGGRRWQLAILGGIDAQFDLANGTDNTGWDGNYGFMLTTDREDGKLAYKLGIFHTSAHIGDEWIERTGLRRIGYTREEALSAVSWSWAPGWRTYAEAGWAYHLRNRELMEPGRVQAGFEYEAPQKFFRDLLRWYAAGDLSSWEERDWRLDFGFQAGVLSRPNRRTWRLGLQFWDGRVPLGEFFQTTESSLSLGLWTEP